MWRVFSVLAVLGACSSWGHDLSLDVSGMTTRTSASNPRVGAVGLGVSGAFDFNDSWSLTGMFQYTRDLATRTTETVSPGSNVFLANLGVMWLPNDHLMTMLSGVFSPPSVQQNATTVTTRLGMPVDVVLTSKNWSAGATWNGLWNSGGLSDFEHTIDVSAGFTRFTSFQQMTVPTTVRSQLLLNGCESGLNIEICPLLKGVSSPLLQGRFSLGYTATLFAKTDVGLDAAYYLYDVDPSSVGYFSLLAFNQAELGNGVPVLPLQVTVKGLVAHRFGKVSVRVGYQFGLYTGGQGALHVLSARVSWKVTDHWRLGVTAIGQADVSAGQLNNSGGQALLGATYVW